MLITLYYELSMTELFSWFTQTDGRTTDGQAAMLNDASCGGGLRSKISIIRYFDGVL